MSIKEPFITWMGTPYIKSTTRIVNESMLTIEVRNKSSYKFLSLRASLPRGRKGQIG